MAYIGHLEFVGQILGLCTEYLKVLSLCKTLVGIAAVVFLTIQKFEYFAHLAGKYLFASLQVCFGGKNRDNRHFFIPMRMQ